MICPVCNSLLVVVEYHRIELDFCPRCQGVWFDSGEVELLLKSTGREDAPRFLDDLLTGKDAARAEGKRKCPICHRAMRKTACSQQPGILIDACRNKDGLWFDGGEIDQLLRQIAGTRTTAPDTLPPVAAFLAETFEGRDRTAKSAG
ncbi:MAG: zf-TFIIB domain-containing protein [Chloroflexi bacterium]|nr:zf-TFIIB domain-containing protein [Chloroflexota bacterium]